MKVLKLTFILFTLLCVCSCGNNSDTKLVLNPNCDSISSKSLTVDKVVLTDSMTIIDLSYQFDEGNYIYISPDAFIEADNKKYKLIGTKNIYTTEKHAELIHWRNFTFSLIFQPVPLSTEYISFYESEEEGNTGWSIKNINLKSANQTFKYDDLSMGKQYESLIDVVEEEPQQEGDFADYPTPSSYPAPEPQEEYNYYCLKCYTALTATKANEPRPNSGQCINGNHQWTNYGKVGNHLYECSLCGFSIKLERRTYNTQGCPVHNHKQHRWIERY